MLDGEDAAYIAWKATLVDNATMLEAIRHNWRIELWGEGYGLQTFRRYGLLVTIGDNHRRTGKKDIVPSTPLLFTFELPTGELYYNPYIRQESTADTKSMRKQY